MTDSAISQTRNRQPRLLRVDELHIIVWFAMLTATKDLFVVLTAGVSLISTALDFVNRFWTYAVSISYVEAAYTGLMAETTTGRNRSSR